MKQNYSAQLMVNGCISYSYPEGITEILLEIFIYCFIS